LANNLRIKEFLFFADGPFCVYCYDKFEKFTDKGLTIDHLVPKKFGGSNRAHNLVLSCEVCNHMKDSKGGAGIDELINYILQKRRNRELFKKIKKETIPNRVLFRLPLEIKRRYIRTRKY